MPDPIYCVASFVSASDFVLLLDHGGLLTMRGTIESDGGSSIAALLVAIVEGALENVFASAC